MDMGGLLQIRNVPEATRRRIKTRAAEQGLSMNDYLLRLLEEETRQPTLAELTVRIGSRAERGTESSAAGIRLERDARG